MSDELIISDGISGGQWWATYRRRVRADGTPGGLQRVKSPKLPLRERKEDAEHDLAVWLAERAPVTRQDRARRARNLIDRGQLAEAWHELQLGLSEPAHPDKPMHPINICALAVFMRWPEDAEQVLAAYGQGEVSNG